jgi:hypothetical protein
VQLNGLSLKSNQCHCTFIVVWMSCFDQLMSKTCLLTPFIQCFVNVGGGGNDNISVDVFQVRAAAAEYFGRAPDHTHRFLSKVNGVTSLVFIYAKYATLINCASHLSAPKDHRCPQRQKTHHCRLSEKCPASSYTRMCLFYYLVRNRVKPQ